MSKYKNITKKLNIIIKNTHDNDIKEENLYLNSLNNDNDTDLKCEAEVNFIEANIIQNKIEFIHNKDITIEIIIEKC